MTWDFVIGWGFGILSVGAIFLSRYLATGIKNITDKIPKG